MEVCAAAVVLSFVALNSFRETPNSQGLRPLPVVLEELEQNLDSGEAPSLRELARDYPRTPLILFYQSLEEVEANRWKPAEQRLIDLWTTPKAREALETWGIRHPQFQVRANTLATAFLNHVRDGDDPWSVARLNPLFSTLELIVNLDKANANARLGMATIIETRGDYQQAKQILTELIDTDTDKTSPEARELLRKCFQLRARVNTLLSGQLLAESRGKIDFRQVDVYLAGATHDLKEVQSLLGPNDVGAQFEADYVRCQATLNKAKAESLLGQRKAAIEHLQETHKLLTKVEPRSREFDHFKRMKKAASDLLEQETTHDADLSRADLRPRETP